jgi:18S rRNA (guanine1575-N7)-methyltransferase
MTTQVELTERCLEILAIPEGRRALILDIGCGSGISGSVISENGHIWVGMDISKSMLGIARKNEVEGDLLQGDIGQGFSFRPGTFDYAISVSVVQWLCNAEKSCHNPYRRLKVFFQSLYNCLVLGARCCFQFYPDNPQQLDMITNAALENGFTGGLVVDFPHSSKAKKYYLFLQAGYTKETLNEVVQTLPNAIQDDSEEEDEHVDYNKKRFDLNKKRESRTYSNKSGKNSVIRKKDRQRRQGREVRPDTKYTARKRPGKGF